MPRTGSSGTAYGSVPTSARALSSVSGGPVRAYGPTMRPTVGAGAVDRWLAVARSERRDGTVRGCGESEQLIRTRDKRPLLVQTGAALATLRHVRFQVVRLARRQLAVEIAVQRALIHVRHVHPSFSLRMLPPGGGGLGRGSYRWRRAPAPSAPRSRRTTIPNPTAAALPGRAA